MKGEVYNQSVCIMQKAADLYYLQNKTQTEISKILNVSKPTVSRLLKRVYKENVVEFVIRKPFADCLDMEKTLKRRYGLWEVLVAPAGEDRDDPETVKQAVALEGARYIQRIITPDDILGIAWGGTMYYLIQYLNPCRKIDARFVTLHGSLSCCDYELDVRALVSRMAMAFGGRYYALTHPGLQGSPQQLNALLREDTVKRILSLFSRTTISISGIGSLYPQPTSPLSRIQYLKPEEFELLRQKGVYGDLMLHFFDKNGRECVSEVRDRTLSIDLDVYRKIPHKVIVASGKCKAHTVQAALRGGLADVLITDRVLAQAICRL